MFNDNHLKWNDENDDDDDDDNQTDQQSDREKKKFENLKKFFVEQFLPNEWPKKYRSYDLRLTLFASALYSLKTTTVLKPYPDDYYDHDHQEIRRHQLIKVFETISGPINRVISLSDHQCHNRHTVQLIHWILSQGSFDLKHVKIEEIDQKARDILGDNLEEQRNRLRPNHLFAVTYPDDRYRSRKFNDLAAQYGSFYAFHGSPMENFHSILHNGLIYSLNKRNMLGIGTYFSSKLEVAILFSPFGLNNFKGSRLGKKLSCVAMCEIVDHPDIEAKKKKDTYYVVTNDELIRVAYLLLYSSDSSINNLHHLNVSSIPFGNPESIETSTKSNVAFLLIMFLFAFIGFFITKSPDS
ncbi:poly(ADP-ribose) polymerase 16 [Dermatophagoides pteronyssinus]|uniref:poly(ADP-ribose) polymerase 16 n=1 Tax=Dermatophagoides pteronyssinus TaxID=6956 RepID=UPI003F662AB0